MNEERKTQDLTETQVADFLERNPAFLARRPELLDTPGPPVRYGGEDGGLDFQQAVIEKVHNPIVRLATRSDAVVEADAGEVGVIRRTHDAVLSLVEAESLSALLESVENVLPVVLNVDGARLVFEAADPDPLAETPLRRIPAGAVAPLVRGQVMHVQSCARGTPEIFGSLADLMRVEYVARISAEGLPPGVFALGSRYADAFAGTQEGAVYAFLVQVLKRCVVRCLTPFSQE